jgi:ribonucleoside-triphosphate reductase
MNLDYVIKRDGKKVEFKSEKIENAVAMAVSAVKQADPKIAAEITAEVLSYLKIFFKNGGTVEVEQIQDLVEKVLIEKGYAEIAKAYILYREQHSKLRDSKKLFADAVDIMDDYLDRSDWKVNENSNMSYSLQGLNNYIASEVTGQYWLQEIYPEETADLHSSGDLHIHDLGNLSVYCCGWDLEELLRTGFRGVTTKIESLPPKHLKTALGQIVNFFYTLQGESAGAQAFSNFDTYLAPFIAYDGLNYEEVKQAMQEFLFNMNIPTRVGFQTPFTNITMDLEVPNYLKDQAVIIGGQYQEKCYGEFQQEMEMLNRAFAELMMEGDAKGRMFSFPIPTYNITEDFEWENKKLDPVWEMTAKFGIPYFSNFINSDMDPEDARSMAILGAQEVIYKNQNGNIAKNEIRHLVNNWIEAPKNKKPDYKMLMDGKFVDIIDMFEVPYENYSTYINIELENGYKQSFSYEHKCAVVRNGEFKEVESQNLLVGDEFLLSRKAYSQSFIGNYQSGKILGYYLGEGWINNHSKGEICFAININRKDIVDEIKNYFNEIACKVKIEKIDSDSIYKINVYGKQAVGFVKDYIRGKKATTKRLNNFVWNSSLEFRTGIVDGLYETDGNKNNNILFHTTNKKLAEDLITLANTVGKRLKYRENNKNTRYFKQDKSDKEIFTSYELKFKDDYNTFKLDNSNFDLVKIKNLRQIGTKTDTVYNFTVDTNRHLYELPNGIITHQCCRLRLDNKELRKRGGGLFGANPLTGSIGVATLNMPRIGYQAQTKEEFMERVYYLMDQAKESLEVKRRVLETLTEQGLYPYAKFYLRDIKKRFDQYWKNHFNTIGLNGMNEALLNFMGKDISTPAGQKFSEEVMEKMRERLQQYQEETDNMYNLEATPAEGTAYRFARLDREKFGDQIIAANQERVIKEDADPYYTNSTQLPVGLTDDIFTALELQDELQSLYTGGCIEKGNKVLTNKGAIKIEKIVRDYENLKPIKALSYNAKEDRSEWDLITDAMSIDVSKNNKIRVTAEKGLDITTSDWHPFFVLEKISVKDKCPICGEKVKGTKSFSTHTRYNPECRKKYKTMFKFKVVEKRADELNIGDYILQNSENLYPEKESLLDNDLMWLFGYFIGDGSISEYEDNRGGNHLKKYKLRFNDEHLSNLEKAKKVINNKFNTDINIIKNDKRSEKLYELATTMYSVNEYFLKYGFFSGEKCYEVNIPEQVKANITKNNVYSLLSGLIDSDGHINKKHGDIEYYTVSEELADDIVEILSTAGIMVSKEDKSSKRKNEVDGFRIRIPAQQATKIKNKLTITNDADFIKDKLSLRKRRQLPVVRVKKTSKIEIEDNEFYDLTTEKNHNYLAGNRTMVFIHNTVLHGFLGEKIDSIKATKKLVRRIAENFKLPYYTLTPSFSICPVHGYLSGEHEYCPKCEAETEAEPETVEANFAFSEKNNSESDVE